VTYTGSHKFENKDLEEIHNILIGILNGISTLIKEQRAKDN